MTAINSFYGMLLKHLFDSLVISPFISGNSIIDIGSGPAFPGILLAILIPDKNYVLIDNSGKKYAF